MCSLLATQHLLEEIESLGVVADEDDLVGRLRVYAVEEPVEDTDRNELRLRGGCLRTSQAQGTSRSTRSARSDPSLCLANCSPRR